MGDNESYTLDVNLTGDELNAFHPLIIGSGDTITIDNEKWEAIEAFKEPFAKVQDVINTLAEDGLTVAHDDLSWNSETESFILNVDHATGTDKLDTAHPLLLANDNLAGDMEINKATWLKIKSFVPPEPETKPDVPEVQPEIPMILDPQPKPEESPTPDPAPETPPTDDDTSNWWE